MKKRASFLWGMAGILLILGLFCVGCDVGGGGLAGALGDARPPGTPTNVRATVNSSTSITISWSLVDNAQEYYVYPRTGTRTRATTTSHTFTGLSPSTEYTYSVSASNRSGESERSAEVSAKTNEAAATIPNYPEGVSALATSSSSITVSWNVVSNAAEYHVYRSTQNSGTYPRVGTVTGTSFVDSGLAAGTRYYYRVTSVNSAGESRNSSTVDATTQTGARNGSVTLRNISSAYVSVWFYADAPHYENFTSGPGYTSIDVFANATYTWTDLPTGIPLVLYVYRGSNADERTFTLTSGQRRTFTWNGSIFQ